ncbi:sulfatase modifying factor 1 [Klebsiella pneumoniae]|nr:sulfatase modifying factor 1 [Klebsiella pneumoniae]
MNQDDKVLHKVVLSDFSISKFKVTNDDYNKYLQITGIKKPPINILVKEYPSLQKDDYSVGVTWQQAKDYCQWLGKESDKNIDLPTEAQWEYAARSRGQYLPFSTNNGNFELGSNIPEQKKLDEYTDGYGFPIYPIGKYPPNPLGLYDMGLSGAERSNDWYSTDYYSHSPVYDPQGPVKGNEKVLRGYVGGDRQYTLTIFRQSSQPVPKFAGRDDYQKFGVSPLFVFRCVINK